MTGRDVHVGLYRLLAALGFPRPETNAEGLPAIAWTDTKTGIAQPSDRVPDGWDVVYFDSRLRALAIFCTYLVDLRRSQMDPTFHFVPNTPPAATTQQTTEGSYHAFYRLLSGLGFPQPERNMAGLPSVAWPTSKTGVAFPGDSVPDGWSVVHLGTELPVLGAVATLLVRHQLRISGASATRRISSDEQRLLDAMLQKGLPAPDRNLKVVDDEGKFRGVMDFAWEDISEVTVRVAVELDGWHWHGGGDWIEEMARLANEDQNVEKVVNTELRSRVARDAAKRRVLSRRGWIVLQVTDDEVRRPGGAERVAEEIRATISRRFLDASNEGAIAAPEPASTTGRFN